MSSNNHNGHAVSSLPGSTILRVPQASPQAQPQPQPVQQAPRPVTQPLGPPVQQAQPAPAQAPQPPIQLAPLGVPAVVPMQQQQRQATPNPIAGVTKIVQENKRELLFAGAGAFLATMFANGNTPRFPGGGGGRT